jgi:hypothetical protein
MLELVELLGDALRCRRRLLPVRFFERAQNVGARDHTHHLAVPEDGDSAGARPGDEPHDLGERRALFARDDIGAHDALHGRMREPVSDRLVEVLARDDADEVLRLADLHAALAMPLAEDHRMRDRVVR